MALPTTYNTGTATVSANGTTATGQGTTWLTSGLQGGDIFWAGGISVRLLSVNSNTSITFAYPWPGAARTADTYEVRFTPEATRVLASTRAVLDALTNGVLYSLAALPTAADKLPYFTGAGTAALTNFGSLSRSLLAGTSQTAMRATLGLALVASSGAIADLTGTMLDAQYRDGLKVLLTAPANMDIVTDAGWYRSTTSTTGRPLTTNGVYQVFPIDAQTVVQIWYRANASDVYIRRSAGGVYPATWDRCYSTTAELDARIAGALIQAAPATAFDIGDVGTTGQGSFLANGNFGDTAGAVGTYGGAMSFGAANSNRRRGAIAAVITGTDTQYGMGLLGRASTSTSSNAIVLLGGFKHDGALFMGTVNDIAINASRHFIHRAYTVATLPAASAHQNCIVIASNGRAFNGAGVLEGAGAGTGVAVQSNGSVWKIVGTNITVSA